MADLITLAQALRATPAIMAEEAAARIEVLEAENAELRAENAHSEPPADPLTDAYKASRLAARATAEAALAAAVAHTTRMEAAGYRLLGAVWVLGAGVAAGTAAGGAQPRENGAGVGVVGEGGI